MQFVVIVLNIQKYSAARLRFEFHPKKLLGTGVHKYSRCDISRQCGTGKTDKKINDYI